jgi:CheY-like chemotaxis protein
MNPTVDLILVDISTSGIGGLDTVARMKSLRPELPVIALTATSAPADKELAVNAECDDLLSKPINNQLFIESVLKHLPASPKQQT